LRLASRANARIHPTFKQHGTLTGRLSCADPNLQQIPRDSEIKKLFLPDEGKQLWEFDYRNIEMRLAAVYAKEETMLETFRQEGDIHQLVADTLGIDRQLAKIVNFLILYGGGRNKLAQQIKCTPAKADTILGSYRTNYPGLFTVAQTANDKAEINGYIQMWSGRRRHFKYESEYHKAFNAVIQGGAFEIVKRSGLALYEAGYDLRNQVHDSWWIQLSPGESHDKIRSIMEDWTMDSFGLRFTVDEKRLN
jgi:DNA polymerase-1